MAVRIKDIASQLGVSDATVSLALSGNPRISAATRERVLAAAKQLGYRPNTAARALRTESTKALGLIVSDVSNPFFGELAGEIERQAGASGYSVMLCNSDEDVERQDEYLSELLGGRRADGVILVPVASSTPALREAAAGRAKMVILDRPLTVPGTGEQANYLRSLPTVRSDATEALREAAEMLVALGHKRIGVVAPPQTTPLAENDAARSVTPW
ncbi:LacI family DNA-binding transcriptional regulator [Branchiibius cervicis]|uniref:LacI family DNA-binding transcriptional regulator n=1 Tax=Branchiibius cervicis TaxID=908252 RepID=A0ABW2AWC0_9MICO